MYHNRLQIHQDTQVYRLRRFKINEEDVSDELFLEAFEGVMDLVRQLLKEKPEEFAHPTFFELLFLMGIYIFDKAHMEYVVLDVILCIFAEIKPCDQPYEET